MNTLFEVALRIRASSAKNASSVNPRVSGESVKTSHMGFGIGDNLESSRKSGYESLSIGYLLIAFAVSILIAWLADDWILVLPIFLLTSGGYYFFLGAVLQPGEKDVKPSMRDSIFYLFWGGTLVLVGAIWLLNREFPGNVPLLVALFIIWIGAFVLVLSIPRLRKSA